jgi:hypothetical protein
MTSYTSTTDIRLKVRPISNRQLHNPPNRGRPSQLSGRGIWSRCLDQRRQVPSDLARGAGSVKKSFLGIDRNALGRWPVRQRTARDRRWDAGLRIDSQSVNGPGRLIRDVEERRARRRWRGVVAAAGTAGVAAASATGEDHTAKYRPKNVRTLGVPSAIGSHDSPGPDGPRVSFGSIGSSYSIAPARCL